MANNYFIAYDLDTPGQDYRKIEKAISECGNAIKVQLSLYYLSSAHSASTVLDHCTKALDANDRIIVITASDATWKNPLAGSSEFMKKMWSV